VRQSRIMLAGHSLLASHVLSIVTDSYAPLNGREMRDVGERRCRNFNVLATMQSRSVANCCARQKAKRATPADHIASVRLGEIAKRCASPHQTHADIGRRVAARRLVIYFRSTQRVGAEYPIRNRT
jgi:hypothetical protein